MSLTPSQLAAKKRVEAAGGVFIAPADYKRLIVPKQGVIPKRKFGKVQRVTATPGSVVYVNVPKTNVSYKVDTKSGKMVKINRKK